MNPSENLGGAHSSSDTGEPPVDKSCDAITQTKEGKFFTESEQGRLDSLASFSAFRAH